MQTRIPLATLSLALAIPLSSCAAPAALQWTACPGDMTGSFPDLAHRLQCATLAVPMDHQAPDQGTINIAVTRVSAGSPKQRQGILVTAPGGPGGPAGIFTAELANEWEEGESPELQRIAEQFDLIGITPRGVDDNGRSTALICQSQQLQRPYNNISDDLSTANTRAIAAHASATAQACLDQPLTPYITSEQTARDIDLVRQLLGEETLSYWGESYGTELGYWYAGLFPQRVNRMILDSSVDWTQDLYRTFFTTSDSRQEIFDRFVVDAAVAEPARYGLGETAREVKQRFADLPSRYREIVRVAYHAPEALMAAEFLHAARLEQPDSTLDQLWQLIEAHRFSVDEDVHSEAVRIAMEAAPDLYLSPAPPAPVKLSNGESMKWTVACQNTAPIPSPGEWVEMAREWSQRNPVGSSADAYPICAFWTQPSPPRPDTSRLNQLENLVMIHAEFDGQTPRQGAFNAFANVPAASMIHAQGVQAHGFMGGGISECVDELAGAFMADGVKPQRWAVCGTATQRSR